MQSLSSSLTDRLKALGPGLLFAGAAIGVSHLVQSTRAGAEYGFYLLWAVILANLFKYPFFEYGPRFTMATGYSLLAGYKKLGYWVLLLFLLVSLFTVLTIQAAVTAVTAAIMGIILPFDLAPHSWSAILLGICFLILAIGHYAWLDKSMKAIIVILSITTLIAVSGALAVDQGGAENLQVTFSWRDSLNIAFLIGLMGWMPAPIDLSVWHSLWALEKKQMQKGYHYRSSLFDFRLGYVGAAFLAVCFLTLGALVMFSSGDSFPARGSAFAAKLIELYTQSLGGWAYWIISIAALTTMFSTTLTCFDAIPRVLSKTFVLLFYNEHDEHAVRERRLYWLILLLLFGSTLIVIRYFSDNMIQLVQLATILSFLTAPFFALANFSLVRGRMMPVEHRPGLFLRVLSWMGIIFLFTFSIFYVWISWFASG